MEHQHSYTRDQSCDTCRELRNEYAASAQAKRRARNVTRIQEYKATNPCVVCGNSYPHKAMILRSKRGQAWVSVLNGLGVDRLEQELSRLTVYCLVHDALRSHEDRL